MSNNLFNEVQKTWFQMPPYQKNVIDSACVYCHQGFDMQHVKHISDVKTIATGLYIFEVEVFHLDWSKTLTFSFERRVDVIKGHREFCRAYKKIEEFVYVPVAEEKSSIRSRGMDDDTVPCV